MSCVISESNFCPSSEWRSRRYRFLRQQPSQSVRTAIRPPTPARSLSLRAINPAVTVAAAGAVAAPAPEGVAAAVVDPQRPRAVAAAVPAPVEAARAAVPRSAAVVPAAAMVVGAAASRGVGMVPAVAPYLEAAMVPAAV